MNVDEFLRQSGVEFARIQHQQAFTAQAVAQAEHVSGKEMAKTVIVKSEDEFFMLVLQGCKLVDLDKASQVVGAPVEMATEGETKRLFPDVEIGAEPPFGSQFGLQTFVDSGLAQQPQIVFRAGTHTATIRMSYGDYEKLEKPRVADFAAM